MAVASVDPGKGLASDLYVAVSPMRRAIDAILLLDGRQVVEQLLTFTRQPDRESALLALCEGIQANPLWHQLEDTKLVARAWPEPLIAVFGHFSAEQRARLADLAAQLDEVLVRHRYVDYFAAEQATERLAIALRLRFSEEALSRFRYTAIPRGGWIVLGMLSYLLNLRSDQIGIPGIGTQEVWVVVDDCALSGVRFQQFLQRFDAPVVIFCPLFAARELCRAIEEAEPRVEACINAEDLMDVAPERFGEAYPQWVQERRERMGDKGYWCGIAEYVAFAWCEPETKHWNAEAGCFEAGWNILPPRLCLKRRTLPVEQWVSRGGPVGSEASEGVGLQVVECGPIQCTDRVLWASFGSSIAVASFALEAGERATCFHLDSTAADMWRALLATGSMEGAMSELLNDYAVAPEMLCGDLVFLVAELEGNGILCYR